jgi:3-phosphoshikimate 1-carboxyvinyltransferase
MTEILVRSGGPLRGKLRPPSDKSISHRSFLLATLSDGPCEIRSPLASDDVKSTLGLCRHLGLEVEGDFERGFQVTPPAELREPEDVVDCGNSGTTARLGIGFLAGLPVTTTLTGDASLRGRPMRRVVDPLVSQGAQVLGRASGDRLPLTIQGGELGALDYELPVASGQVKGALLLAALSASGEVRLTGRLEGRDHTERMLAATGVELHTSAREIRLIGPQRPRAFSMDVPADPSSAAFFLVAAALTPGSDVTLVGVGLNPGRTGILTVLEAMGADIRVEPEGETLGEPWGRIRIRGGPLQGVAWDPEWVVGAIDEIPVLAVAAAYAEGETVIAGAEELRVKESDRLATTASELRKLGAEVEERPDGLVLAGGGGLRGARVEAHHDHRIAMAMAVAALRAQGSTVIDGADVVAVSYPRFFTDLERLRS